MPNVRAYSKHTKEAVTCLSVLIKTYRKQRKWSEQNLADRAGISRATLQKIESGDLGCSVGLVFEVASLVGVPLFEGDHNAVAAQVNQAKQTLALLPKRIRTKERVVSDDF